MHIVHFEQPPKSHVCVQKCPKSGFCLIWAPKYWIINIIWMTLVWIPWNWHWGPTMKMYHCWMSFEYSRLSLNSHGIVHQLPERRPEGLLSQTIYIEYIKERIFINFTLANMTTVYFLPGLVLVPNICEFRTWFSLLRIGALLSGRTSLSHTAALSDKFVLHKNYGCYLVIKKDHQSH